MISRDRLLERVWGYDRSIETRSVDVHVGRLRSKLGAPGGKSKRWSASATDSLKSSSAGAEVVADASESCADFRCQKPAQLARP